MYPSVYRQVFITQRQQIVTHSRIRVDCLAGKYKILSTFFSMTRQEID